MKVKELRKALKKFDDDLDVKVRNIDTLGDDIWDVEDLVFHAETPSISGTKPAFVVVS